MKLYTQLLQTADRTASQWLVASQPLRSSFVFHIWNAFTAGCKPRPAADSSVHSPPPPGTRFPMRPCRVFCFCSRYSQDDCHGVGSSCPFTNLRNQCHTNLAQPLSTGTNTWQDGAPSPWQSSALLSVCCAVQIYKPNRERQGNALGGEGFSFHHRNVKTQALANSPLPVNPS